MTACDSPAPLAIAEEFLRVPAPAKLNLFLHILGRREDGYHLLQSAFVLIDWCDWLGFALRPESPRISREDLSQALPEHDLIVRAAAALQQAAGERRGVHIRVEKHIPAQAGMGGGSSDAASALLALNRLWGLHWPVQRLQRIGLQLGADVPFFLGGANAWVEGIGERLTPLQGESALPPSRFIVIKPAAGVATAAIFSHPALQRGSERATISRFSADPFGFGRNDLQPVAQILCPEIKKAIDWLSGQGFQARMTGSGSAVFARVPQDCSQEHLLNVLAAAQSASSAWMVRLCNTLQSHPLSDWICAA
ncbi:MAG: 4-(cytidine 5'-diphospho)-2-C-methyl-D-erythritol kinase [Comamonadaceae bacterium]|nr:4-(cytidine 5'-diphospho)-2-C-methyl-D-erythritol kinase [Comamonadaceae bacterium]